MPVSGATIELDLNGRVVAKAETGPNGDFKFDSEPPGTYIVLIRARGYQNARLSPDLIVAAGSAEVSFQAALLRAPQGLKTIGYVTTSGTAALQATSTINTHVDAAVIQAYDYQRLGDALTAVPGVITSTSSSVGDDMSVSIRGFDPTETSTLLDGHPIGPIGAFGGGYNYNVSPFWGISGSTVVFGSGANGLFGATTIAGAVDLQSINPTRENHFSVTQGVGTNDKLMTGFLGTGTIGNLGYAFAWGSQGTTGAFPGGYITQPGLLQTSTVHPGFQGNDPPPDLTAKNVNNTLNTYWVTGQYSQKDFVGKVKYQFTPRTSLQLTAYSATDWSNSTGQGDNDYQTWPYVLFGAEQTIAGFSKGVDTILVGGKRRSCHNTIAVLVSTPPGYTCMTAPQYATAFYGPFGGSVDRVRWLGNQDYDARLQQGLGASTFTVEYFADAYNYTPQKGPAEPLGQYTTVGPGPYYQNLYKNRGFLISDDFSLSKHDLGFGYSWLRQANTNMSFPYSFPNGNTVNDIGSNPPLYLATASYFVRDTWTPSQKLQVFGNFWIQRSLDTSSTHFDPRVSVVYRPTTSDLVRATYGRSYSEPDPSLLALAPPVYGAPSSVNCPPVTTGSASLTSIASVANPDLVPEDANDIELAYGHRFNRFTNIQADLYQTWENQALLSGLVPISSIHQVTVPQNLIDQYIAKLAKCPGLNPSINSLAFSTTYNAAGARYRGIVLSGGVGLA
ncbi:MAG TPA: TonB-dependent receptor, partial [Candidatus Baltobacteraceae bacterium]|nr:TonB-dependent receptor [Candidatus Baltobacteraceae bacterium]